MAGVFGAGVAQSLLDLVVRAGDVDRMQRQGNFDEFLLGGHGVLFAILLAWKIPQQHCEICR